MFMGDSILEAIDWMQDRLKTTRPLAEQMMFGMLRDKKICETEQGFASTENFKEEDMIRKHINMKQGQSYGGYRFHRARTYAKKLHPMIERHVFVQKIHHMENLRNAKHYDPTVLAPDIAEDIEGDFE